MRVCSEPRCPTLIDHPGKCAQHAAQAEHRRGSRQQRGYTAEHDRLRRQWAPKVATGKVQCARCHQPIKSTQPWALDHRDDRTGYLGPSHVTCNNSAGGRLAHRNP